MYSSYQLRKTGDMNARNYITVKASWKYFPLSEWAKTAGERGKGIKM